VGGPCHQPCPIEVDGAYTAVSASGAVRIQGGVPYDEDADVVGLCKDPGRDDGISKGFSKL